MVDLGTEVAHLGVPLPLTPGGFNITGTPRCATCYILRQLRKWPRAKATTILKGSHRTKLSCHESTRLWGDALRHAKNWSVLTAITMNMVIICSPARQYITQTKVSLAPSVSKEVGKRASSMPPTKLNVSRESGSNGHTSGS